MRKRNTDPRETTQLIEYVLSDDCTADIQKLRAGVFDFPLPQRRCPLGAGKPKRA